MPINLSTTLSNISVNTTSNVVTVSSTPVNVTVSATSIVSNSAVREAISVSNLSGFGNLTYDNGANSNGVIQYTGVSNSDIRGLFSNTAPITYNSSTGAIGLEQTLDDLTLKKYQETIVSNGNSSGNITLDLAQGTIQKYTLTGNITKITPSNLSTGGSATLILTQDSTGGHVIDTLTHPLEWVTWDFVNDFTSLDTNANAFNILNFIYDGSKYYASLVVDGEIQPDSLTVTGNVSAGNISTSGTATATGNITSSANINAAGGTLTGTVTSNADITTTGNITANKLSGDGQGITNLPTLSNAQVKTFLEANGLDVTGANLTSTANVSGANVIGTYLFGDGSNITGIPQGDITEVAAGSGLTGGATSGVATLAVGAGTGITVNPDNVAVNMGAFDTDNLSEGTTNLYFSNARAVAATTNAFISRGADNHIAGEGANTVIYSEGGIGAGGGTNKLRLSGNTDIIGISTNDTVGLHFVANADANFGTNSNLSLSTSSVIKGDGRIDIGGNVDTSGTLKSSGALGLALTGNATIGGNLNVTGNINSANVVDLFVEDRNITLQFGTSGSPSANSQIFVDRGSSSNTFIIWNEGNDKFGFSNDGANITYFAETTDDLTEGSTNLYFTAARARGQVSVTTGTPSGNGALSYTSGTGVFDFTPADVPNNTDELAQGSTNLYFTTAQANTAIGAYTGNLQAVNTTGNITTTANISGGNILGTFIGNITGNVTGSPSSLAGLDTDNLSEGSTNLYYTDARFDTRLAAKSTSNLTEGSNLYFTIPRANAAFDDRLDSIGTAISSNANITTTANISGGNIIGTVVGTVTGEVNTTSNITTTANTSAGNVLTDNIISGSSANVNIKGQANGIHFNKTISSTETRIFDVDTEGYGIKDADVGTNFDNVSFKSLMCQLTATAGGNTATISPLFGGAFGTSIMFGRQTSATAFTSSFGVGATAEAALTNAVASGGCGANAKGWTVYVLADSSSTTSLPKESFMTSISGNVATFSENFTQNIAAGGSGFSALLVAGAASTTQNIAFSIDTDTSNTSIPFVSIRPRYSEYDLPSTLSNVTLDAISYNTSGGSSTVDLANVVTRNMAEIKTNSGSGFRLTDGSLLIGNSLTPDVSTIGQNTLQPSKASLQGIATELDGITTYTVDNAPMNKLNMYNFTDNSIPVLSAGASNVLPTWTTFLGQSGNNVVDARQLGAPTIDMRMIGGNSSNRDVTNLAVGSNIAIGKINFGGRSLDLTAVDPFYAPTSISVYTAKDRATTDNVASADFYITNTHKTSYRNGANVASGGIPSTFIANQAGNTVIATKADGTISLRPQRDYGADGTTGNATYTQNRFPDELHEFHTFLSAGYLGTKAGTLVEIQAKSGQTFDNTDGFNYDSKGNATLRLSTHEANSAVKQQYDLTSDQSTGNILLRDVTNSRNILVGDTDSVGVNLYSIKEIHGKGDDGFGVGGITFKTQSITQPVAIGDSVFRLYARTTAQINATSPSAGDILYNSDLNKIVFYNGSAWRKLSDEAM